ncbi:MAG: serine hydrolase domain-containing protein [Planctomycetota bacterium]
MTLSMIIAIACTPLLQIGLDEALGERLNRFVAYTCHFEDGVQGGVLVGRDGERLLAKGYGIADAETERPITDRTLWDVASISKQFTAAAVLVLEQREELSLSDPLSKFFEAVPDDKEAVTIRQLLGHVSGIANRYSLEQAEGVDFSSREDAIAFYLSLPMTSEPGAEWAYSNLGYNLVAAILEKVSGKSWEQLMVEDVLRPAGLNETWPLGHEDLPRTRVPRGERGEGVAFPYGEVSHWAGYRGAGGIHTTIGDLFLWDRVLRDDRLLSAESRRLMFAPLRESYALGWKIETASDGHRRASHGGLVPGFLSHVIRGLDDNVIVAVLTSETSPDRAVVLAETLYAMARGAHVIVPAESEPDDIADMRNLAGRYVSVDETEMTVQVTGGGLDVSMSSWEATAELLVSEGLFVDGGATVNEMLPAVLKRLDSDPPHLAEDVTKETLDEWRRLLGEDSALRDHEILGYYFPEIGQVDQFVRLQFENVSTRARFRWQFGKLRQIELDSAYPSHRFERAGPGIYRHGNEESWRGCLIRFTEDTIQVGGTRRTFRRIG